MEKFYVSIGMPISISQKGIDISDEQIRELAYKCSFHETRTIGTIMPLKKEDMQQIYSMARG